jgi:hypothetical protein
MPYFDLGQGLSGSGIWGVHPIDRARLEHECLWRNSIYETIPCPAGRRLCGRPSGVLDLIGGLTDLELDAPAAKVPSSPVVVLFYPRSYKNAHE